MRYLLTTTLSVFFCISLSAQWLDDGNNRIRTENQVSLVPVGATTGNWHPNTSYLLSIDGNFATEELRVQIDNVWPDYVFLPDYPLMPLPQVQSFIKEQGHLPGLPSTEQVAEQELGLGEAHRLLTEKIEELALYLIESHERKQELLAKVERLEAKLKKQNK